jgi:hypothetical protein
MFNPNALLSEVPLHDGHVCLVFDNALSEPQRLIDLAVQYRERFVEGEWNAYPGPELRMPESFTARLSDYFALHARKRLGGRRTLRAHSRLALVTRDPQQLHPWQWICHRDQLCIELGIRIAASVLYLFEDESLGGTSFYRPLKTSEQIEQIVDDSGALPAAEFSAKYQLEPSYMGAGNAWFERTATVPARFNRLIFYRGDVFHSGGIARPDLLSPDPRKGRLCLNGFFTCRASAAGG